MQNFQYADQHLEFCNQQQLLKHGQQPFISLEQKNTKCQIKQNLINQHSKVPFLSIQNIKKNPIKKMTKKSKNFQNQIKKMEQNINKHKLKLSQNQQKKNQKQNQNKQSTCNPFLKYKQYKINCTEVQNIFTIKQNYLQGNSNIKFQDNQKKIENIEFLKVDKKNQNIFEKQKTQISESKINIHRRTISDSQKIKSNRKMSQCQKEDKILQRLCKQLDQIQSKNNQKNNQSIITQFKTTRTLKRARTACSVKQKTVAQTDFQIQPSKKEERCSSQTRVSNLYYSKMRQRVMTQMDKYKKIKQTREAQQKKIQLLHGSKKRKFQSKKEFIIEGLGIQTQKIRLQLNSKKKYQQQRRPVTGLSRTGLQFTNRQSNRRAQSIKERDKVQEILAGPNNKANLYFNFSKNANREVEELNQSKTQRVIRTLRKMERQSCKPSRTKTFSKNQMKQRPKTGRSVGSCKSSIENCIQRLTVNKRSDSIDYHQITKKQIQKQKFKEKTLDLIIKCQQQKNQNNRLKKGMDIFQFYCQNVDEGLKQIQKTLSSYMKKIQ